MCFFGFLILIVLSSLSVLVWVLLVEILWCVRMVLLICWLMEWIGFSVFCGFWKIIVIVELCILCRLVVVSCVMLWLWKVMCFCEICFDLFSRCVIVKLVIDLLDLFLLMMLRVLFLVSDNEILCMVLIGLWCVENVMLRLLMFSSGFFVIIMYVVLDWGCCVVCY